MLRQIREPKTYIRGKYDLWFLFFYLKNIEPLNLSTVFPATSNLPKIIRDKRKFELNAANVFDILGSKMKTPSDIKFFLLKKKNRLLLLHLISQILRITSKCIFYLRFKY